MVLLVWKLTTVEGKLHLQQPMVAKLATHQLVLVLLAEMLMEARTCTVKDLQLRHRCFTLRCHFFWQALPVCACLMCLLDHFVHAAGKRMVTRWS